MAGVEYKSKRRFSFAGGSSRAAAISRARKLKNGGTVSIHLRSNLRSKDTDDVESANEWIKKKR